MDRITISLPKEKKKIIKMRAIESEMTLSEYILKATELLESKKEGTIYEAIRQMENGEYETMTGKEFKQMLIDMDNE